jgi:hypothetical protein
MVHASQVVLPLLVLLGVTVTSIILYTITAEGYSSSLLSAISWRQHQCEVAVSGCRRHV